MTALRIAAGIVGLAILATVASAVILATGGYGWDTNAPMTIALAAAVAVGSPVARQFFVTGDRGLGWLIVLALVCGEAYGFVATASWHMTHLDALQAPAREALAKHNEAQARVDALARDDRVQRAEHDAKAAREDATTKSIAPGCGTSCKATLAKAVDDATAAISEARSSLELEQRQARAALDKAPLPGQIDPLAAALGVPVWEKGLTEAGLRSVALTILAACLLTYACHPRSSPQPTPTASKPKPIANNAKPVGSVSKWMLVATEAQATAKAEWGAMLAAYRQWCKANGFDPVTASKFADSLNVICEQTGIETKAAGKRIYCLGLTLAS
jgi:hypothetical protein